MRRLNALLFCFILLLITAQSKAAEPAAQFNIASFNIHYSLAKRSKNDWAPRKQAVSAVLQEMGADIIAFQEMETFEGNQFSNLNIQLDWIQQSVKGYGVAAVGKPEIYPSTQPILYKKALFTVEEQGFFFFSKTPDVIYSEQWNGGYPYFCSWVRFTHLPSNQQFYVLNVHNDFRSYKNRLRTSTLIVERLQPLQQSGLPIIVLGDFNEPEGFKTLDILQETGLKLAPPQGATNRVLGFNILPAIDHILANERVQFAADIKVWRSKYDGVYPSDHYPLSVDVQF